MTDHKSEHGARETSASFEAAAAEERRGLLGEFWDFLAHNKKWWLLPIVLTVLALGALLLLGGSGFAPFIYTLF